MAKLYYETVRCGLVPVRLVERHEAGDWFYPLATVTVVVVEDHGPYRKGQLIRTLPRFIVEKSGVSPAGFQLVRTAQLPA